MIFFHTHLETLYLHLAMAGITFSALRTSPVLAFSRTLPLHVDSEQTG
jgi:hypothetical protein